MSPLAKLVRPLLGLGGAAYGAATAEEDESPALRALGYGTLGGVLGPMGAAALARGYKKGGAAGAATDYTYFSLLSSPDTIARGNMGAVGGAFQAALEKSLTGLARGNTEEMAQGARILTSLVTEGPSMYAKALRANPREYDRMLRSVMPKGALREERYTGGVGIGKMFGAPDMVAVQAMKRGGMSADEAARYTLTGTPQSKFSQNVLETQQRLRDKGGLTEFAATQLAPFARVGLLGLEKGLQRTPGVGILANRLMKTGASPLEQAVQQGLGAGAGALGYYSEDLGIDPRVGMVLGPALGPAFLPMSAGRALRRQQEQGDTSVPALVGELLQESSPLGFQPAALAYRPGTEVPRRFIPSGVADVAEALDPSFRRKTGAGDVRGAVERGELAQPTLGTSAAGVTAASRIPGLREQLPEEFMPTDIFGQPRFQTQEVLGDPGPGAERNDLLRALSRTLFPGRTSGMPPALRQSDPRQAIFRELGLDPAPPSTRVNVPGLNIPLQHTAESAAAVARHRGLARQLTGRLLENMPALRNMPDGPQKQLLTEQISQMVQRQLSGALSAGTLPLALSQGAQLPDWLRKPL